MREKSSVEFTTLPERSHGTNLSILKCLFPLLKPYKFEIAVACLSLVIATLSTLGIGYFGRQIIDYLSLESMEQTSIPLLFYWGLLGSAFMFMALSSFGRTYYVSWLGERLITDLRQKIFQHLLSLDVGYFESIRAGELLSRLTTDTTLIQIVVGTSAALAIRNFLLFGGGFIFMVFISPKLTFICLMVVPIILIPLIILGRRVKIKSRQTQDSIASLSGYLEESLSSIRTCYAFGRESIEYNRFCEESEKGFHVAVQRLLAKSWLTLLVMLLIALSIGSVVWLGAHPYVSGDITPGQLIAFVFYALMVSGTLGSFSEISADLHRAAGAAERLFDILATPSKMVEIDKPRPLPTPTRGVIAFHNVSFSYPYNPKEQILRNVTFSIAPGEKIAIVGPSGSGKSTILSLLMRFFDPQSGSIYVDGVDIQETSLSNLRTRFGIVPQDPMIFSGTLYENIAYGDAHASPDDVWRAAESAYLLDYIKTLPQGIHTPLGARGIRLSGGQKQRLAIARVFLRNAPILLLDEATSALDAQSEKAIQESLKTLMLTRTTVVVAHRLSTVLKADNIVVLNKGHVEAVGTHAELISEDGLYRRLATLQFIDSLQRSPDRPERRHDPRVAWK